jgi:hypothetical protein
MSKHSENKTSSDSAIAADSKPREPLTYARPNLKFYGSVADMTAAGSGGASEGSGQSANDPTRRN